MDDTKVILQSMYAHTKEAYDRVEYLGGELPAKKNLANLPDAIRSIPQGPAVPTSLAELKKAVRQGREIVVGTEIPDTWNGNSNPLIVAQNLNSTNNSDYGGAEGVILIRKYAEPTSQTFGNIDYPASTIKFYLDGTYLNNCSDDLKGIISEIAVPYNGTTVMSKFFIMSATEVCGQWSVSGTDSAVEGIMLDIWKNRTGLSSINNNPNSGRIVRDRNGSAQAWWLRTKSIPTSTTLCRVTDTGEVRGGYSPTGSLSVLPACFIGKD